MAVIISARTATPIAAPVALLVGRLQSTRRLIVLILASSLLAGPSALLAKQGGEPIVAVTGGRVQGIALPADGGAVFKGIPFARPPVGDLRWREPQPVVAWAGVRPATAYGAPCAQADSGWNRQVAAMGSEDCLYLNVWTSARAASAKLPVMVWVHGGGNSGGSAMGGASIEPPFDGASLSRRGVVVVTLNYRLGVFGFMGHAELAAESPHHASGDYGLQDQLAALRWVRDNIARFGGDPGNVTLFGQSAGAQDTTILLGSPLTRGLVHKAIAESGTPMIDDKRLLSRAQIEELGAVVGAVMKAPVAGTVRYLRGLPATQILASAGPLREALMAKHLMFEAGADGYVVPRGAADAYRAGTDHPVPLIVGNNGQDAPGPRPRGNTPDELRADVRQRVGSFYAAYPDLEARALLAYGLDGSAAGDPTALALRWSVDRGFRCESTTLARWHGAVAPTYQYQFTAGNEGHPPVHSAELDFVFGYLRDQAADPALATLSDQMQRYWTNFARTGDPNGSGLPAWPRNTGAARRYLEFGNAHPQAKTDLGGAHCDIYAAKLDRDLAARR